MTFKPSHIALATVAAMAAMVASSCGKESSWDKYEDWRVANEEWYQSELKRVGEDGLPYYTVLNPVWNNTAEVLIHYHNDRKLTEGNLSPLQTSTVAVKYRLKIYGDVVADSSYSATDSLAYFQVNGVVSGWQVALNDMRCGDSATVVIPYLMGYGTSGSTTGSISPYSTLMFDIKLVDIPYYEVPQP